MLITKENTMEDDGKIWVRLGVKTALGARGSLVAVTPEQRADLGIYATDLEPAEVDWIHGRTPDPVPDAPVWNDSDDDDGDASTTRLFPPASGDD